MRLIDADELMHMLGTDFDTLYETVFDTIRRVPTIDAVPVVHGKWIYEGARGRFPACRCSVCGNVENADWAMISGEVNYCPNCGADMRGEDDVEQSD